VKVSVEIENGGKESEEDSEDVVTPFQRKVAKMLAKMAGRKTPNEIDLDAAADFEEDNIEYKMAMKGMKK
jgi:hypothetical protein